jgi:hypothetical protein
VKVKVYDTTGQQPMRGFDERAACGYVDDDDVVPRPHAGADDARLPGP